MNIDVHLTESSNENIQNDFKVKNHLENVSTALSDIKSGTKSEIKILKSRINKNEKLEELQSKIDWIEHEIVKCNSSLSEQNQLIKNEICKQAENHCNKTWKAVSKKYMSSIEGCIEFVDNAKSHFKDLQNNLSDM